MNYKDWYSKVIKKETNKVDNKKSVFGPITWDDWLDYIGDNYQEMEVDVEEIPY